jgi:hypothetical protein
VTPYATAARNNTTAIANHTLPTRLGVLGFTYLLQHIMATAFKYVTTIDRGSPFEFDSPEEGSLPSRLKEMCRASPDAICCFAEICKQVDKQVAHAYASCATYKGSSMRCLLVGCGDHRSFESFMSPNEAFRDLSFE